MKPYYEEDGITIYHGDCAEILPQLSRVDLVFTSPPYNLRGARGTDFGHLAEGYETFGDDMTDSDYQEWQRSVLRQCWSSLSDDGAIFYNHKPSVTGSIVRLPLNLLPPELPLRQIVIWDQTGGFNHQPHYFIPSHEWIMVLARPAFRLNTMSIHDVWRFPRDTHNEHPAPFPLSLARRVVSSTNAVLVLDPFMGSGTTLRAAKDEGRHAIGIEISERYCDMAIQRLAQMSLPLEVAG